jgi:hypothetical protein
MRSITRIQSLDHICTNGPETMRTRGSMLREADLPKAVEDKVNISTQEALEATAGVTYVSEIVGQSRAVVK